jgi:hypothetical protein
MHRGSESAKVLLRPSHTVRNLGGSGIREQAAFIAHCFSWLPEGFLIPHADDPH